VTHAPELTAFQREAERIVLGALHERGLAVDTREVRSGDVPFFSDQRQVLLKLSSGSVVVLLHDDEVSYTSPTASGGLERADFQSEAEVLQALRALLPTLLKGMQGA